MTPIYVICQTDNWGESRLVSDDHYYTTREQAEAAAQLWSEDGSDDEVDGECYVVELTAHTTL